METLDTVVLTKPFPVFSKTSDKETQGVKK